MICESLKFHINMYGDAFSMAADGVGELYVDGVAGQTKGMESSSSVGEPAFDLRLDIESTAAQRMKSNHSLEKWICSILTKPIVWLVKMWNS